MKVRVAPQLLPPSLEWRWTRHFNLLGFVATMCAVVARITGRVKDAPIAYLSAGLMFFAIGYWLRSRHLAKKLEEAIAAAADSERLAAIGLLTAGFAHEQRNAVMVLQGFAELARNGATQSQVPAALQSQLETIDKQSRQLLTELQSFLALTRGETVASQSLPLKTALEQTDHLLRPLARTKDKAFESDIGDGLTREVGDPTFRQALLNLGLNAINHARTAIHLRALCEGDFIVVSVENDGPSLSDEESARLFEPFVTGRSGGIGLGLHQVRTAVEQEAGTVRGEPLAGGGMRFTIRLPVEPVLAAIPAHKSA